MLKFRFFVLFKFLFLIQNFLIIFFWCKFIKKYLFKLLKVFISCFMTFYRWIRNRIPTIWLDPTKKVRIRPDPQHCCWPEYLPAYPSPNRGGWTPLPPWRPACSCPGRWRSWPGMASRWRRPSWPLAPDPGHQPGRWSEQPPAAPTVCKVRIKF